MVGIHHTHLLRRGNVMSVNLSGQGDNRLKGALADVTERFQAANPDSYDRWQAARDVMPGGNTRTVLHYDPFPVAMIKGSWPPQNRSRRRIQSPEEFKTWCHTIDCWHSAIRSMVPSRKENDAFH